MRATRKKRPITRELRPGEAVRIGPFENGRTIDEQLRYLRRVMTDVEISLVSLRADNSVHALGQVTINDTLLGISRGPVKIAADVIDDLQEFFITATPDRVLEALDRDEGKQVN